MSKYKFSNCERYAVWKNLGPNCYWCGEPMRFNEVTIDHVIPESLIDKPIELNKVINEFGMDSNFKINSYSNWLPCHQRCNSSKNGKVFKAVPMHIAILEKLEKNKSKIQETEERIRNDIKKDTFIAKLHIAMKSSIITKDDINSLFQNLGIPENDEDLKFVKQQIEIHVNPEIWKVISLNGNIATVTDGKSGGITPNTKIPHVSWTCPYCGEYGPWNGARCLTCGHFSDPND